MPETPTILRTRGDAIVDADGARVALRGVGLGGWMNMENFITGYPATESQMRAAVQGVLGPQRAQRFFDRLLMRFFEAQDAQLLARLGVNCVRVPVNYRHFERDERPFELRQEGFALLDRAVRLCAEQAIYTVIDLHAAPGCQNQHWHSDNPTHVAIFWQHPHFQDRVVHLWRALAERYRDEPWVAGYNLLNEPADPGGEVVGPFHDRLVAAIREVDREHIVFVDGNTYSTDFSMFAEPYDNAVYACHDYARAGMAFGGPYPGDTQGRRFGALIEKKTRLGVDSWGSTDGEVPEAVEPIHELVAREFRNWAPYPWSARGTTDDLVRHVLFAQAMLGEYAERFRDLADDELDELAESFSLARCVVRTRLCELIASRTPQVARQA